MILRKLMISLMKLLNYQGINQKTMLVYIHYIHLYLDSSKDLSAL